MNGLFLKSPASATAELLRIFIFYGFYYINNQSACRQGFKRLRMLLFDDTNIYNYLLVYQIHLQIITKF